QSPEKPLERDKDIGPIAKESHLFSEIPVKEKIQMPSTTLVKIDTLHKRILFSDEMLGEFFILSNDLNKIDSFKVGVGVADVRIKDSSFWMLSMGILHPSDEQA